MCTPLHRILFVSESVEAVRSRSAVQGTFGKMLPVIINLTLSTRHESEQEALIAGGLNNLQSQQNYRELSSRITRLMGVIEASKAR
jgi:hypothetical protein